MLNGSGMHRVAESIAKAEIALGLDSILVNVLDAATFDPANDADIHVCHTHLADQFLYSGKPIVWVGHGTPEVMIESTYESACIDKSYGHGDSFMLAQYWLQHADALVTFWPRHKVIWKSLCDKHTQVDCVTLGVDKTIWYPGVSEGKFSGNPSVLTAENHSRIKWPMDLYIAWPWIVEKIHSAKLHSVYVPYNQHRLWFPLVNRNGTSFSSVITETLFDAPHLRNAFVSTDFYCGLVRYGDFNMTCLQAKASGAKVISYAGNFYADYWITEGDQRRIAEELVTILSGEVESLSTVPIPDISQTAQEMKAIYDKL